MNEDLKKLLDNEVLMTGLVECSTPEELGELLEKNNIVLEEGLSLEEAFKMVKDSENGELDENALDEVSGGIALTVAMGAVGAIVLAGSVLSFIGGYAYQTAKNIANSKKKK